MARLSSLRQWKVARPSAEESSSSSGFYRDVTSDGETSEVYSLEGVLADKLSKVESYDICTGIMKGKSQ